jgi:hypothetical protein
MKTPKINWKKFMAEFSDLAHEMDINIEKLLYNKNGVSFELIPEDLGPTKRVLTEITYFSIVNGKILFKVRDHGVEEIVSTPHGAFAVCAI